MNIPAEERQRDKCDLALEGLRAFGEVRLRASGVSMLPTLLPGDLLVIRRASHDDVSGGDIVLYRRNDSLFVHRVIESAPARLITGGDSMATPDPEGPIELLGKVTSVERNGRARPLNPRLGLLTKWTGSLLCHSPRARSLFLRVQRKRNFPPAEIDPHSAGVLK
jgi:signal peptidase I